MSTMPRAETRRADALTVREIFQDHARFVMRVLRRLGVPEADVDDQAQEVFVVVHRKLDQLHDPSGVRAWLSAIARGVASDHRRRAHVRREKPTEVVPDAGTSPTQERAVERKEARALLESALDELDDDKRAVFVLYELEQMPMPEVAEALGCPVQTAYSRLHAARDRVRSHVKRSVGRRS